MTTKESQFKKMFSLSSNSIKSVIKRRIHADFLNEIINKPLVVISKKILSIKLFRIAMEKREHIIEMTCATISHKSTNDRN